MTWLRRNLIALLLLPLLLVGIAAPDAKSLYYLWWKGLPWHEITASEGGTVQIGPTTVRLVEVAVVHPLMRDTRKPPDLPAGYTFWQARIAFHLGSELGLALCEITMVDQLGREFSVSSTLVNGTDLKPAAEDCGTSDTADDADKVTFENMYYFVLPPGAEPQSIRIVPGGDLLPDYVRFVLT